jgi:3-oxoacyl-[acyl-carrier protein] reductase
MIFANKIALVTGASRGIGKAIALELGKKGATVIGADLMPEQAAAITEFCQAEGIKGRGFAMDVSKIESIEAGMAEIVKTFGAPNILVNNAGIARDNLLMRMSQEEWDKVLTTNLSSVFWLSKICIRDMLKARWGRIINIASVVAFTGNPGQTNYTASKGAVVSFTKTLALEVASRGITINAIAPGYIDSDMTAKLNDEQRAAILDAVPLRRTGKPEDVAKAVAFLASEDASYITGTTLHVSGGMYMA